MSRGSGFLGSHSAVDTITHQGRTAESHDEKARMLKDISFPPHSIRGDMGIEGLSGTAYQKVSERLVAAIFRGTNCKKSLGPDGIGPLAIRCIYD